MGIRGQSTFHNQNTISPKWGITATESRVGSQQPGRAIATVGMGAGAVGQQRTAVDRRANSPHGGQQPGNCPLHARQKRTISRFPDDSSMAWAEFGLGGFAYNQEGRHEPWRRARAGAHSRDRREAAGKRHLVAFSSKSETGESAAAARSAHRIRTPKAANPGRYFIHDSHQIHDSHTRFTT